MLKDILTLCAGFTLLLFGMMKLRDRKSVV